MFKLDELTNYQNQHWSINIDRCLWQASWGRQRALRAQKQELDLIAWDATSDQHNCFLNTWTAGPAHDNNSVSYNPTPKGDRSEGFYIRMSISVFNPSWFWLILLKTRMFYIWQASLHGGAIVWNMFRSRFGLGNHLKEVNSGSQHLIIFVSLTFDLEIWLSEQLHIYRPSTLTLSVWTP